MTWLKTKELRGLMAETDPVTMQNYVVHQGTKVSLGAVHPDWALIFKVRATGHRFQLHGFHLHRSTDDELKAGEHGSDEGGPPASAARGSTGTYYQGYDEGKELAGRDAEVYISLQAWQIVHQLTSTGFHIRSELSPDRDRLFIMIGLPYQLLEEEADVMQIGER